MPLSLNRRWRSLLVAAVTALAACSSLPPPPALSDAEVIEQPTYRIAPGDTISVFVWRSPELSTTVPVRPDGRISLPLADELVVAGRTPVEVARDVERALQPFVQVPKASVVVDKFADDAGRSVRVLGEVKRPTSLAYRPYVTVLDLVVAAEGLTEFADGNSAKLIRREDGGDGQTYRLELEDLIVNGDMAKNARLKPGDLVIVPPSLL